MEANKIACLRKESVDKLHEIHTSASPNNCESMFIHSQSRNGTKVRESEFLAITQSAQKRLRDTDKIIKLWQESPFKCCSKSINFERNTENNIYISRFPRMRRHEKKCLIENGSSHSSQDRTLCNIAKLRILNKDNQAVNLRNKLRKMIKGRMKNGNILQFSNKDVFINKTKLHKNFYENKRQNLPIIGSVDGYENINSKERLPKVNSKDSFTKKCAYLNSSNTFETFTQYYKDGSERLKLLNNFKNITSAINKRYLIRKTTIKSGTSLY